MPLTNKQRVRAYIEPGVAREVAADPTRATRRARVLYDQAREESRLAKLHKQRARRAWMTFSVFKDNLERLGIQVVVEEPDQPTHPRRRTSDDEDPAAAR